MWRVLARIGCGVMAGLCACASDVWFKPGAGPEALARDKATCAAEVADASLDPRAAFEECMAGRDWWHVVPGGGEEVALLDDQVIELPADPEDAIPEDTIREPTDPSLPTVGAGLLDTPSPGAESSRESSAAPEPPAARTTAGGAPARTVIRLRQRPADPSKRQFWFKFGAGTTQLAAEQQECRAELGLEAEAPSPSRWGENADFDRCMREKGWLGGSVQAP